MQTAVRPLDAGRTGARRQRGEGEEHRERGEEEVEVQAGVEAEDGPQPQEVHHAGEARGEEDVHCVVVLGTLVG